MTCVSVTSLRSSEHVTLVTQVGGGGGGLTWGGGGEVSIYSMHPDDKCYLCFLVKGNHRAS